MPAGAAVISPQRKITVLNLGAHFFPRSELLARGVDVVGIAGVAHDQNRSRVPSVALEHAVDAIPAEWDAVVVDASVGNSGIALLYCDALSDAMRAQTVLAGVGPGSKVFKGYGISHYSFPGHDDVRNELANTMVDIL